MTKSTVLRLPLTNTGRNYGYITWPKRREAEVRQFFGRRESLDLQLEQKLQRGKRIDWERRRIGITYTLTRNLPKNVKQIFLKWSQNKVIVTFE